MWTPQLRSLMLKMSQMRSDARCFEYGEHEEIQNNLFILFLASTDYEVKWSALQDWKYVAGKLPWHVFLLFGGGMALADGCKV